MNHNESTIPAIDLRALLLELARREEDLACAEASAAPYWAPTPSSVLAHRSAAALLRLQADVLLQPRAA